MLVTDTGIELLTARYGGREGRRDGGKERLR